MAVPRDKYVRQLVTRAEWSQGLLSAARGRLGLPVAAEGGGAGALA
ncbi:hypothetical protein ACIBI8_31350 [Streptomyces sp. NPDC050529]